MDANAKELVKRSGKAFARKETFDGLCQTLADNYYPERAQFTTTHDWGEEFGVHLFDSSPVLYRRDLGNAFSSMLRPRGQPWFSESVEDDRLLDQPGVRQYLDWRTNRLRKFLYNGRSGFVRSTKEADHDYATFGNGILTCEENHTKDGLLFRCWHMKDCAWVEDMDGRPDTVFRNISMAARQIKQFFREKGDSIHREVEKACEKDPDKCFKVRHIMMPAEDYEYQNRKRAPRGARYVSIYIDCDNEHLMREAPSFEFRYVIPRWQTISGSPYAVSPAAMTSLPDARTMQSMARVMLEGAEKAVDPPMKATEEAVRGDINLYGGGITWVDREYDEKLGPALEPIINGGQVGLGVDMLMRLQMQLKDAWYLTKLQLPQQGEKTAYETAQLVEEFIRASIPLFEPLETEYNVPLLEMAAETLQRLGALGTADDVPDALSGEDTQYTFSNPLQDAIQKNKVFQYQTVVQIAGAAMEMDPAARHNFNITEAARDAIEGSGAPAEWLHDREYADEQAQAEQQQAQMQQAMQEAGMAGEAAERVGSGGQALQGMLQQ